MSICVLGMWPKNRLYANIPPSWQMDGLAAIRPALRSMLDVRIGYDALIQAIGLGLTFNCTLKGVNRCLSRRLTGIV